MKRLLGLFIFFLLLIPKPTFAAENWSISSFDSKIEVLKSGKVDITETITADFGNDPHHGIFRYIPVNYRDEKGAVSYSKIDFKTILANSSDVPYQISTANGYITAKIGNPGKTITGTHVYTISYEVSGMIRDFTDHEEFYWNVVGSRWEVPILKTNVIVISPEGFKPQTTCYVGVVGSKNLCNKIENLNKATFSSFQPLGQGSDLSVVLGYPKNSIALLNINQPENVNYSHGANFSENNFSFSVNPISLGLFFLTLILGFGFLFYQWWRAGRDFFWKRAYPNDPKQISEEEPLFTHETVVVEYTPPENLRPAEVGVLISQMAQPLDITATIVDLANRGYIKIIEVPKTWILGNKDYQFVKLKNPNGELLEYESNLLGQLIPGEVNSVVSLSSLKYTFYKTVKAINSMIYAELTAKGYFNGNPEKVRNLYGGVGSVLGVGGFLGVFFAGKIVPELSLFSASLCLVGLGTILFSLFMPRRTASGHDLYLRCLGFQLFITKAEKYRQQFFEKENMFNDMLPYAIRFNCTEKFAKAFADMGIEPKQPAWYVGTGTFSAAAFSSSLSGFATASSSSGFSGGGGGAGGGGGGGGGGGW